MGIRGVPPRVAAATPGRLWLGWVAWRDGSQMRVWRRTDKLSLMLDLLSKGWSRSCTASFEWDKERERERERGVVFDQFAQKKLEKKRLSSWLRLDSRSIGGLALFVHHSEVAWDCSVRRFG